MKPFSFSSESPSNFSQLSEYPFQPQPSLCFNPSRHDDEIKRDAFALRKNHIFQAANRHLKHPKIQSFLEDRCSTSKEDPNFLDDFFWLVVEIDREEYAAMVKNLE